MINFYFHCQDFVRKEEINSQLPHVSFRECGGCKINKPVNKCLNKFISAKYAVHSRNSPWNSHFVIGATAIPHLKSCLSLSFPSNARMAVVTYPPYPHPHTAMLSLSINGSLFTRSLKKEVYHPRML